MPRSSGSFRPRLLRRFIANPVTMLVLLVLFALEVERVRGYEGVGRRSSLATVLRWEAPPPRTALVSERNIYIVRQEDGWRLLEPDRESWDEATRVLTSQPEDVITARAVHDRFDEGLIHPTRRIETHLLEHEVGFGGTFSEDEVREARRSLAQHLGWSAVAVAHVERADEAGLAEARIESHLLRGYVLNVYMVLLGAGLGFSLLWIPDTAAAIRRQRRRRALARQRCPSCGYDMKGAEEDLCPECGSPFGVREP